LSYLANGSSLFNLPLQQRTKASQKEDGQAFSAKRLEEVFNKYKEEGEDEPMIGTTGMEKFCQDLEIDPEDVRFLLHDFSATHLISPSTPIQVITLVIAYHLKAQQMGCFTKEEFMKGFEALGYPLSPLSAHLCLWLTMASPFLDRLDTLDKIKKHMPKFRAELDDAVTFKNIYRFTFDFSKEPQQKCIGKCDSHNPNSTKVAGAVTPRLLRPPPVFSC
jgi:DCN1-like protein 4/5